MRPILLIAVLLSSLAATTRAIDTTASRATFSVQHIYVEHVTGTVPVASGVVTLSEGSVVPIAIVATLDPARLRTGDDDRDGVLQTPDWFDTKRFPAWSFASTRIVPDGSGRFGVDGILTIHGVGVPEHLDVTVAGDAAHPRYRAVARVDRHAFGMTVTRLDPVIGSTVDVTLDIALK
jgi:polyisoprenoid-binding protein YceI